MIIYRVYPEAIKHTGGLSRKTFPKRVKNGLVWKVRAKTVSEFLFALGLKKSDNGTIKQLPEDPTGAVVVYPTDLEGENLSKEVEAGFLACLRSGQTKKPYDISEYTPLDGCELRSGYEYNGVECSVVCPKDFDFVTGHFIPGSLDDEVEAVQSVEQETAEPNEDASQTKYPFEYDTNVIYLTDEHGNYLSAEQSEKVREILIWGYGEIIGDYDEIGGYYRFEIYGSFSDVQADDTIYRIVCDSDFDFSNINRTLSPDYDDSKTWYICVRNMSGEKLSYDDACDVISEIDYGCIEIIGDYDSINKYVKVRYGHEKYIIECDEGWDPKKHYTKVLNEVTEAPTIAEAEPVGVASPAVGCS
jgi:hypothetical protein